MKKHIFFLPILFALSCNNGSTTSADKDKLDLETKRLELERKKLEFEREKLNSGKGNEEMTSEVSTPKARVKTVYVSKPSESEQTDVIRRFYEDFDNAYDYGSMNAYIGRYYSATLQAKYTKTEGPSYNAYASKYHNIQRVSLISESDNSRSFRVEFYFEYTKSNGRSASVLCADVLTLDNSNRIVGRNEIGKIG
ncbi:MAG: hypothetical protein ACK444_07730 [Flavobacteriales bacterium]|jgi:hypothetical protein